MTSSNKRAYEMGRLEDGGLSSKRSRPGTRDSNDGHHHQNESHAASQKRNYEVVDLVEGTRAIELIFKIVHEPEIGRWIHQIRYQPPCEDCQLEVHLPEPGQLDFLVAQTDKIKFLDLGGRAMIAERIRKGNEDAIFLVLLLLCPNLRVLQLDGPGTEFGRTLRDLYAQQRVQHNPAGPPFPTIEIIDIIESKLCKCPSHTWQHLSPFFFIPGVRSISVFKMQFGTGNVKEGDMCTLENVSLEGLDLLPEELAKMIQCLPSVNDWCYSDLRNFREYKKCQCRADHFGWESYRERLAEAVDQNPGKLLVQCLGNQIRVRNRVGRSSAGSRCGFGVLSRPFQRRGRW